eukprot:17823-Heterococcus_DN1.PRE.1
MISATFFDYIACAHSLVFMSPLVSHVVNVHLPVDVSTDVAFVRLEHEGALYSDVAIVQLFEATMQLQAKLAVT